MTPAQVHTALELVCDRIIEAEPILSEADRKLGDGDHGLGMQRGFEAAREKLGTLSPEEPLDKMFSSVGMALISSMGGASGAVFGTMFRNGGKTLAGREKFDAAGLADFLQAALEGVMARGGAKPGDKTMIDALHPAAECAAKVREEPIAEALGKVVKAAEKGTESSKDLLATMGRAKSLGERSLGHPDPGALSVCVILTALRDALR